MKASGLTVWFFMLIISAVLSGAAAAQAPQPPGYGIESVHNSYVYHNLAVSPEDCSLRGTSQTFCFQAISYTTDWDYIYYLWLRFPTGWTISDVTLSETPYCINGGTFDNDNFSFLNISDNEVKIDHKRYQADPSDTCTAYYCVQVTPGANSPGVGYGNVSWYWRSSEFGSTPFYPCSSDGYTPTGQPACDEAITPPAYIDSCPGVFLPAVFK